MFGFLKRRILIRELKRLLDRWEERGYMNFLKAFFGGSKKATAVLVGVLVVVLQTGLGLDEATVAAIVKLIMAYVGGQAVVDLGLAFSGAKEK